jgi:phosphonate transport system substrate-binding protein
MTPSLHRAVLAFSLCLAVRGGATEAPLRVSMIPITDPSKMLRDAQPLVARLEQATGRKVTLTIPQNYAAVVEAMVQGKVDLAHFGGLTFVQATVRAGAVPLVQRQRDRDFHARFITARDDIRSLQDLAGRRFAFGDVNSTSGHLMPAYFMRKEGVDPAVIEQAIYTGGHDATVLAVSEGRVDAGALDEAVWDRLVEEGKIDGSKVRVFWTTPPFVDYVWAARKDLDPALAKKLAQVFLALDPARPEDQPILELLSAKCQLRSHSYDCDVSMNRLNEILTQGKTYPYVKVDAATYAPLRQAAIQEGLLR